MNLPDFLTVVEAARVLRIGRTVAYEQAARYEATGGAEGLPVVRLGRQFRVPRAQLEALAGGPLSPAEPAPDAPSAPAPGKTLATVPELADAPQAALPFSA
jgi:hypothetical protein